jgi:AraC-like DNA-binding protein
VSIRVKQTLEDALTDAHPQSLTSIARQLQCDIGSLQRYFPNLRQAISTRYAERININYEQIKKHLQEMLAGERELLSFTEFVRKEGCNRYMLARRFPDEYKRTVEQYRIERRKQHSRRIEQSCIEVRQVVFMLHQQGIRPGYRNLLRGVSSPHILRKKEVYETWRALLGELGYKADT